jgi:HNH endonuclease
MRNNKWMEPEFRLQSIVEVNVRTNCWESSASVDKDGYAYFYFDGTKRGAISVWRMSKGEIPLGFMVCHTCDNRRCLNIAHLFLGTAKDNTQDAISKRRLIGPRKVTAAVKQEIINMRECGLPIQDIADEFSISIRSVQNYIPKELKRIGNYRSK